MNKKLIIIIVSVLALMLLFLLFNSKQVKYITKPVSQETITQYVEASGTIKPINTIAVGTQVSGTVAKIYVDYNSVVKKGDMLAELDPSLFQSNVDQSTAKLNNARASLSRATASLNYKKNNYQRYKNLYAKNYVSKDEVELAYSNYQQALAEVSSASAEVNAAQATLNNNMTNLGYSKITSPVDGTVISRAVDEGQTVDNNETYASSQNYIIWRYAEALLDYAEVTFRLGDPTTALGYVNDVRQRVHMEPHTDITWEKIVNERRIEMAFEETTYWDHFRWGTAVEKLNGKSNPLKKVIITIDNGQTTYTVDNLNGRFPGRVRVFQEKQYYLPIPWADIRYHDVEQNPGWAEV